MEHSEAPRYKVKLQSGDMGHKINYLLRVSTHILSNISWIMGNDEDVD